MKYTVTNTTPSIDKGTGQQFKDNYGNLSWNVWVTDEQGQTINFLKRTKAGSPAPKAGDVLEGHFETATSANGNSYQKFVADQQEGGYRGGGAPRARDPEERDEIMRQNALTNAVNYCTTKAQIFMAEKKYDKAMEEMSGKHVVAVATYFHGYTKGKTIASMTPEDIAQQFGYEPPTPQPVPLSSEETDIADIPF